jgi:hypothetical protein
MAIVNTVATTKMAVMSCLIRTRGRNGRLARLGARAHFSTAYGMKTIANTRIAMSTTTNKPAAI